MAPRVRAIDRRLPEHIALEGFVADFEVGLWQALRRRFPRLRHPGLCLPLVTGSVQEDPGTWVTGNYREISASHLLSSCGAIYRSQAE
jgi:hypothetical protein